MDRQPILALFLVLATSATALSQPTYPLRYRLQAGEQVVTRVVHEAETQTSIGGVSEDTSASTSSIKVWEVQSVDDQGNMTFVYQIDGVRLRQQLSDSCESYDSQNDHEVPARFRMSRTASPNRWPRLPSLPMDPWLPAIANFVVLSWASAS